VEKLRDGCHQQLLFRLTAQTLGPPARTGGPLAIAPDKAAVACVIHHNTRLPGQFLRIDLALNARWFECQDEAEIKALLEGLQYPHWMILVGTLLVMLGFVGFGFSPGLVRVFGLAKA
jgi:hypothetical protein